MRLRGRPSRQLMLVAAGLTLLLVGVLHFAGSLDESPGAEDETMIGSVLIGEVENNFTERADLHVFAVDEENRTVDAFPSTINPGWERDPRLLSCSKHGNAAAKLRIYFRPEGEEEPREERFVPLEPSDCAEGGGATFSVTATGEGTVRVEKRSAG